MLNKEYNSSIVGLNYVSLIKGITELKADKSTLVIDSDKYLYANMWYLNLGELDKMSLIELGKRYDISPLKQFGKYLVPTNTLLHLDHIFIEFSDSPYASLKELARKFPASFSEFFQSKMLDVDSEDFNQKIHSLVNSLAKNSLIHLDEKNLINYFLESDPLIVDVFKRFSLFMNEEGDLIKELHYALQVMFQTNFSSSVTEVGSMYLLLSLIAPRYNVDEQRLTNDLLFEYRKLGGDIKSSTIEDWGIQDKELKYILLSSVDGLIGVKKCFYFAQLESEKFFSHATDRHYFMSIKLNCIIDHRFVEFFAGKRIVFLNKNRMGGDFPFWEIKIDEDGFLSGTYAFANNLGTKPSFYYHHALEDIYQSLQKILPGFTRSDWLARTKLTKGEDIWLQSATSSKKFRDLYLTANKARVKGIDYCGPDRAPSLGFFGYLLDVFAQ